MTNHELRDIIDKILKKEATTLTEIARNSKVDRPNLAAKINSDKTSQMRRDVVDRIAKEYPQYFDTETTSNKQSDELGYVPAREHIETLRQHNRDLLGIVHAQLAGMDKKLDKIVSNSKDTLAGVKKHTVHLEAISETALQSLSRLEKKKQDALQKEADKKVLEKAGHNAEHRTSNGVGN